MQGTAGRLVGARAKTGLGLPGVMERGAGLVCFSRLYLAEKLCVRGEIRYKTPASLVAYVAR